jgi:hypothetical protein
MPLDATGKLPLAPVADTTAVATAPEPEEITSPVVEV